MPSKSLLDRAAMLRRAATNPLCLGFSQVCALHSELPLISPCRMNSAALRSVIAPLPLCLRFARSSAILVLRRHPTENTIQNIKSDMA